MYGSIVWPLGKLVFLVAVVMNILVTLLTPLLAHTSCWSGPYHTVHIVYNTIPYHTVPCMIWTNF